MCGLHLDRQDQLNKQSHFASALAVRIASLAQLLNEFVTVFASALAVRNASGSRPMLWRSQAFASALAARIASHPLVELGGVLPLCLSARCADCISNPQKPSHTHPHFASALAVRIASHRHKTTSLVVRLCLSARCADCIGNIVQKACNQTAKRCETVDSFSGFHLR